MTQFGPNFVFLDQSLQPFPAEWYSQGRFLTAGSQVGVATATPQPIIALLTSVPSFSVLSLCLFLRVVASSRPQPLASHWPARTIATAASTSRAEAPWSPTCSRWVSTRGCLVSGSPGSSQPEPCPSAGAGEHLQVLGPSVGRLAAAAAAVGAQCGLCPGWSPESHSEGEPPSSPCIFIIFSSMFSLHLLLASSPNIFFQHLLFSIFSPAASPSIFSHLTGWSDSQILIFTPLNLNVIFVRPSLSDDDDLISRPSSRPCRVWLTRRRSLQHSGSVTTTQRR